MALHALVLQLRLALPRPCAAGEVPFESSNASAATDEAFIQLLAHAAAAANSGSDGASSGGVGGKQGGKGGGRHKVAGGGSAAGKKGLEAADLARLQLAEDDVAKVGVALIYAALPVSERNSLLRQHERERRSASRIPL